MLQPISSTGRLMNIGLSSRTVSLIELSVMARWTIVPRLLGVPGVANVAIWGQRDQQLQVIVERHVVRPHRPSVRSLDRYRLFCRWRCADWSIGGSERLHGGGSIHDVVRESRTSRDSRQPLRVTSG